MSENSADSTVDEEEEQEDNRDPKSGGIARRLKALICCFRRTRRSREEIAEYDPDEYDYIVEKLVVKRVPIALFAIPIDLRNLHRPNVFATPSGTTESTSTSGAGSSTVVARYDKMDKTCDRNEDRVSIGQMRRVHVNLKEFKMSRKGSPDNPGNKRSFARDITDPGMTFGAISSNAASSAIIQDGISDKSVPGTSTDNSPLGLGSEKIAKSQAERNNSRQSQDASLIGKIQENFIPARSRRYIVSPFRAVRRGSFDLAKPMSVVIGDPGVNGQSYTEKSVEDKSSGSTEKNAKEDESKSNTAMRWRITVRHQSKNADSGL